MQEVPLAGLVTEGAAGTTVELVRAGVETELDAGAEEADVAVGEVEETAEGTGAELPVFPSHTAGPGIL